MKRLTVSILAVIVLASPLFAQERQVAAPVAAEAQQPAVASEEQVIIRVAGLKDEAAAAKVKQAVLSLEGVKAAEVDILESKITVTHDPAKVQDEHIIEAINYTEYKAESAQ